MSSYTPTPYFKVFKTCNICEKKSHCLATADFLCHRESPFGRAEASNLAS